MIHQFSNFTWLVWHHFMRIGTAISLRPTTFLQYLGYLYGSTVLPCRALFQLVLWAFYCCCQIVMLCYCMLLLRPTFARASPPWKEAWSTWKLTRCLYIVLVVSIRGVLEWLLLFPFPWNHSHSHPIHISSPLPHSHSHFADISILGCSYFHCHQ